MKKIIAKLFFFDYTYLYILFIIVVEMDKKDKETFKKRYLIISFIVGVFSAIVAIIIILVILKYIDINGKVDPIALLSVNVGILQGLMALFGIGVALAAYFNFTQIRDKTKSLENKFDELENKYIELNNQYNLSIDEIDIKINEVDKKLSSFIDDYNITANTNRQEEE